MIINGQQYQQPQHNYIYLQYIGEGYIKDVVECDESDGSDVDENIQEIYQFLRTFCATLLFKTYHFHFLLSIISMHIDNFSHFSHFAALHSA